MIKSVKGVPLRFLSIKNWYQILKVGVIIKYQLI